MSTASNKLTYRDYACFPNDGNRHEVIDGSHFVYPVPSLYHQAVSRRILFQLYPQIELAELGAVINAPVDVELSRFDIIQPDIVVVLKENRIATPTKVKGAPDHVIEILSPSTASNDRTRKRALYQRAGVPEYWIVDPDNHQLVQLKLVEGEYVEQPHDDLTYVTYLEGVSVDLKKVW